jgi:uncharacterized protein
MKRGLLILLIATVAVAAEAPSSYVDDVMRWRKQHQESFRKNWLSLVGLYWLHQGTNSLGADRKNDVILPAGPQRAGTFEFAGGKTTVTLANGTSARLNGKPAASGPIALKPDTSNGGPDQLTIGDVTLTVIERNGRYGIRMRQPNSAAVRDFTGMRFWPIKPEYRIEATWVPFAQPQQVSIPTVLGTPILLPSPGVAEFDVNGNKVRLQPVIEEPGSDELFYIFKDATSATETYPAGRFLYSAMPKHGKVVLDFNEAYSPPCAFTPFATCPLPPKQNLLKVRIEAGELKPAGH